MMSRTKGRAKIAASGRQTRQSMRVAAVLAATCDEGKAAPNDDPAANML